LDETPKGSKAKLLELAETWKMLSWSYPNARKLF